ncbi:MAG: protein phosphatase 2C domain-containing protein [Clostridia bacterium]|nr:protein phosphatase 2C domain-containing protein [Clostridia bacterium]
MLEYATYSSAGERLYNEDTARVFVNAEAGAYCFALADGLGGHGAGDVASNLVTECVGGMVKNEKDFFDLFIDDCFDAAQEILLAEVNERGLSCRTTLCLLFIKDRRATWGHIGDSRIYLFKNGKFSGRTRDHSVVQMLVDTGEIDEKEMRHHEDRSRLLRAMGSEWEDGPEYEVDYRGYEIEPGDVFLLCTDGFWEWLDEKTMSKLIRRGLSPFDTLEKMAAAAVEAGKGKDMDNLSAVLIKVT